MRLALIFAKICRVHKTMAMRVCARRLSVTKARGTEVERRVFRLFFFIRMEYVEGRDVVSCL
jgi:hypothetical protein